ncbi:membrane protein implicated in regulation of membrane protease activity [Evansella vedderi]|uniref:Membrane protein implicated in regulation of membrane protease activity n=1 Tax=Evansella vedderi TaxID=38282 RepID=A0ABT9ZU95_9BACI|nr:hypothetical protein [Evansella vedderi]MDQ0254803.1 membrane protein implicated in regulation of membrane protease activity [Evansella vedderi]
MQPEIKRIAVRFILMYVIFVAILYMTQGHFMWLDGLIFATIYIVLYYFLKKLFGAFKRKAG